MCIIFNFLPCKLSVSPLPPNYSDIPMIVETYYCPQVKVESEVDL